MPCSDGMGFGEGMNGWRDTQERQQRLDAATRAACEAFTLLDILYGDEIPTTIVSQASYAWWLKHKAADAARKR
jgi:hypothetical protein